MTHSKSSPSSAADKPYLPELSADIHVGIVGAGGLGSNIANLLVRSGFQTFEIIDFDFIEPSNLNRQQYFIQDIGKSKVDTLSQHLKNINPNLTIITHKKMLNENNINNHFQDCHIIFEAVDKPETKKLILESFSNSNKLLILGNGMCGTDYHNELKIKKLKNNIYIVGDGKSGHDTHPPYAPRVTACAALMASIALHKFHNIASGA
jgi:sulfur carrier protein ThiS adenylyltransferase